MIVNVHIKEKTIPIQTGPATQPIQWLAHVALTRYSPSKTNYGLKLGIPRGIQRDNGELLDPQEKIKSHIKDGEHLWVVLSDESIISRLPGGAQSLQHQQDFSTSPLNDEHDAESYFNAPQQLDPDENNLNNQ